MADRIFDPDAPNPYAPTARQVDHATRRERRWLQQALPDVGRRDRDMDTVRNRTHGICHSYATTSTLIAAAIIAGARPDTTTPGTGSSRSASGPSRPTERDVIARIDRTDRAMHTWAHCYAPCRICPAPDRPHDETTSLDTWVDCDDTLVDQVVGRSLLSRGITGHIDQLNIAQQDAAMALLDRWDHWWRTGVEPDTLRDVTSRAADLTRRLSRVAHQLGVGQQQQTRRAG